MFVLRWSASQGVVVRMFVAVGTFQIEVARDIMFCRVYGSARRGGKGIFSRYG